MEKELWPEVPEHAEARSRAVGRALEAAAGEQGTLEGATTEQRYTVGLDALQRARERIATESYELITQRNDAEAEVASARGAMYTAIERYGSERRALQQLVARIAANDRDMEKLDAAIVTGRIELATNTAPEIRS